MSQVDSRNPANPSGQAASGRPAQADAVWALETVQQWKQNQGGNWKEMVSHLKKLPAHLQTSGLAQTLLFYGKKQRSIAEKILQRIGLSGSIPDDVKSLASQSPEEYRRKSRHAMRLAQWMKRVAEVLGEERDSHSMATEGRPRGEPGPGGRR